MAWHAIRRDDTKLLSAQAKMSETNTSLKGENYNLRPFKHVEPTTDKGIGFVKLDAIDFSLYVESRHTKGSSK
jgi:hypothetical protein